MSDLRWTDRQKEAIMARGGDILVSAAAGSGKTAVLTERVVTLLSDEKSPVDADTLLVLTFSKAAAAEMKQRIHSRLSQMCSEQEDNTRLRRQMILLESAQISTIHSFCTQTVKSAFQQLGIPADIRIGEQRELEVLSKSVLEGLLRERYEKSEPAFLELVEALSRYRSDDDVENTIRRLFGFVRNHPFYEEWLDRTAAFYSSEADVNANPFTDILLEYARKAIAYSLAQYDESIDIIQSDEKMCSAYYACLNDERNMLSGLLNTLTVGTWDDAYTACSLISFGSLPALRGYAESAEKALVQGKRNDVKNIISHLLEDVFICNEAQMRQDNKLLYPVICQLFDIVKEFGRLFDQEKLKRSIIDFNDLEQLTVRLFYDSDNGVHTVNANAHAAASEYSHILIDEYQDTNELEEMIFAALTQSGPSRFMVGDVKQSIYRFRQAKPEIFLSKKNTFAPFDGKTFPAKIALDSNFRTRREITSFVNHVFESIMNPSVGEMEYGEEDSLKSAGTFDYSSKIPVNFYTVTASAGFPESEAKITAGKIYDLLASHTLIEDKGIKRPIEPRDIAILLRSPKNRAEKYERALAELGIDSYTDKEASLLESPGVASIIAYLKTLSNPGLDYELAKTLASPLYGLSSEELASLRAKFPSARTLFAAVSSAGDRGDRKCAVFLEDFSKLRNTALCSGLSSMLREMLELTSISEKICVRPDGRNDQENIRRILDYAWDFEHEGSWDFSSFISFLYAMEDYGLDMPSAGVSASNSVTVMSVHRSKGLEFPVVFICETAANFVKNDFTDSALISPELGFACLIRDPVNLTERKSIPYAAISIENRRAMLSEELRILYVAMTRAKERLYISGEDKILSMMKKAMTEPKLLGAAREFSTLNASCSYKWLISALVKHPAFAAILEGEENPDIPFNFDLIDPSETEEKELSCTQRPISAEGVGEKGDNKVPAAADSSLMRQRYLSAFSYRYPYRADSVTPIKTSVSELSKQTADNDFIPFRRRPKILLEQSITGAEKGIATHKFMQFASFEAAAANPEKELERLISSAYLSREDAQAVSIKTISAFFASPIGIQALNADRLYREIRFMREFSPEELEAVDKGLSISSGTVIQGVSDLVIVKEGRGTVVDYKTDRVSCAGELSERYSSQLRLYRMILSEHLNMPIDRAIIYSFVLNEEIEII